MKLYLLSLGAGLLIGVIYSLLSVRSPAPPLVALVGLLGILIGEQIIPVGKQLLGGTTSAITGEKAPAAEKIDSRARAPDQPPGTPVAGETSGKERT